MRWRERDGGLGCVNWTGDMASKLDLMIKDMPERARASRRELLSMSPPAMVAGSGI